MKKLILISLLLFSCSPSHKNRKPPSIVVPPHEVAETIKQKEGPIYISKDAPAWKAFTLIFLLITAGCFICTRHKFIHKTWCKVCSKLDKDK